MYNKEYPFHFLAKILLIFNRIFQKVNLALYPLFITHSSLVEKIKRKN